MSMCVRGAITAENTKEDILNKTKEMLEEIIKKNEINIDEIISIIFTATKDLDQVYPAVSAREIGITQASLMCCQELNIEGSLKKCLRVSVTVDNDKKQKDAKHVYLGGAKVLRPDIA